MTNTIIWHQLPNESPENRIDRLNALLHRIFFDGKDVCPERFLLEDDEGKVWCSLCHEHPFKHGTPRFLESLDAMELIVTSGRFAEVREEFYHWLSKEGKPAYECTIPLYGREHDRARFTEKGYSRQEAFYLTALKSQGCSVVVEGQGEQ